MLSFFSPLNLSIWLKRYSLQFAVDTDNIPPQMDSLKHTGNTCQTGLRIPHAAVLSLFGSPSCLQTLTSSTDPTPMPCLSKELHHCYHHHGISLPSVSAVIRRVHHPQNTPTRTIYTLQEPKFKKVFNLTIATSDLSMFFFPQTTKADKKKRQKKKPIPHNVHDRNRCKRIL